jgi:hypothetical protein
MCPHKKNLTFVGLNRPDERSLICVGCTLGRRKKTPLAVPLPNPRPTRTATPNNSPRADLAHRANRISPIARRARPTLPGDDARPAPLRPPPGDDARRCSLRPPKVVAPAPARRRRPLLRPPSPSVGGRRFGSGPCPAAPASGAEPAASPCQVG